jgi:hypothetical protein
MAGLEGKHFAEGAPPTPPLLNSPNCAKLFGLAHTIGFSVLRNSQSAQKKLSHPISLATVVAKARLRSA